VSKCEECEDECPECNEDLAACVMCGEVWDRSELDDNLVCPDCVADERDQREKESDYWSSR
jgi:hypothetical protein